MKSRLTTGNTMTLFNFAENKCLVIIAVDGYSSCGKSTLAKDVARELQYTYLDSGAMYRAVSLYCVENGLTFNKADKIIEALPKIKITFSGEENRTHLNGVDIENEIREPRISNIVSPISAISAVRRFLVEQLRELSKSRKGGDRWPGYRDCCIS